MTLEYLNFIWFKYFPESAASHRFFQLAFQASIVVSLYQALGTHSNEIKTTNQRFEEANILLVEDQYYDSDRAD